MPVINVQNDSAFVVLQQALISINAEKFELEDVDSTSEFSAVYITPDAMFAFDVDASEFPAPSRTSISSFSRDARGVEKLIHNQDLMFNSDTGAWWNHPVHVALLCRLAEIAPDQDFAKQVAERRTAK